MATEPVICPECGAEITHIRYHSAFEVNEADASHMSDRPITLTEAHPCGHLLGETTFTWPSSR